VTSGNELERYVARGEVVWLPDGPYFADGRMFTAADGTRRQKLEGPDSLYADFVATLEGGQRIIGVRRGGPATIWNTADGSVRLQFGENVACAAYSRWGTRALLGGNDGSVSWWDVTSGKKIGELARMGNYVAAVAISVRGDKGLAISDKTMRVFSLPVEVVPHLRNTGAMRQAGAPVTTLVFSTLAPQVIGSGEDKAWSYNLESPSGLGHVPGAAPAASLTLSPDGRRLAIARSNPDRDGYGPILLQQAFLGTNGDPNLRRYKGHAGGTTAAYFARNGSRIISGGNDNYLRTWETVTEEEIDKLEIGAPVRALAVTPQGDRAMVAGDTLEGTVWNLTTKQRLGSLRGHSLPIQSMSLARDAPRLVTTSGDRTARVWDLDTLQPLAAFSHPWGVTAAVIAHDGTWIMTGGADGALRTWSVAEKSAGQVIFAHQGPVTALVLAPDGRTVVSAGEDLTLSWWDVPSFEKQ
jgi:WD40 repeat protein